MRFEHERLPPSAVFKSTTKSFLLNRLAQLRYPSQQILLGFLPYKSTVAVVVAETISEVAGAFFECPGTAARRTSGRVAMIDIGRNSGSSCSRPYRFTNWISMPPAFGRRLRRSGVGEASCPAATRHIMKNSVSLDCAARCKRHKLSLQICACHNRSAPQLPLRSTCSAAHSASAIRSARNQIACEG